MTPGNVWYTGNKNGTVGKLDPKTGKITEFKMPDPNAKDPHTAVFDRRGVLFFTLQLSNMIGRLDPATGDIKLVTMKTADAQPVRHQARRRRLPVGRLQRRALPRQGRPGDVGSHRGQAADRPARRCAVSTSPTTA